MWVGLNLVSCAVVTRPTVGEDGLSDTLDSAVNWYSLGVKLELEDHELSTIEQNYHGGACNGRYKLEMLLSMIESSC